MNINVFSVALLVHLRSQTSPKREHVYTGRAWYLFSCDHHIVEMGLTFLELKSNVLLLFNQLQCMHSMLNVYVHDICSLIARYV